MISALYNAIIYTGEETLTQKAVIIENGFIADIVDQHAISKHANPINLNNHILAPGFIDLQIYGAGGPIFSANPNLQLLKVMEETLLQQGCTGFYATIATNDTKIIEKAIKVAAEYRKFAKGNFLGLHLEGPYINLNRSGAHIKEFIKKGSIEELSYWISLANGEIKMVTIAPELQNKEFVEYLKQQNIVVSIGHSDLNYKDGLIYCDQLDAVTHLFNAMPQIHHRKPGLIPAVFEIKPFTSIIADGKHVDFAMIKLAKTILQERLFLITDAVTETSDGPYPHVLKDNSYSMPDGTLSGSNLSMLQSVKNCVLHVDIPLDEALRMSSTYPARLINSNSQGLIKPGFAANLVLFDQNFNVKNTWLNGTVVTKNC